MSAISFEIDLIFGSFEQRDRGGDVPAAEVARVPKLVVEPVLFLDAEGEVFGSDAFGDDKD